MMLLMLSDEGGGGVATVTRAAGVTHIYISLIFIYEIIDPINYLSPTDHCTAEELQTWQTSFMQMVIWRNASSTN